MATAGRGRGAGPERAFAPDLPALGASLGLGAEESAHLIRARRVGVGEDVVLFDGRGGSVRARVTVADPRGARVEVLGPWPDREPARAVRLAVAVPEAGRADRLVAQLAELGVSRLDWLTSLRALPGRAALPLRRQARWARLVREAAKVSGRSRFLEVGTEALPLPALLATFGADAVLLDPDPALPPLVRCVPAEGELPVVLIGPEGGFSTEEVDAARAAGAGRARLTATALRVETAAVAAATVLATLA